MPDEVWGRPSSWDTLLAKNENANIADGERNERSSTLDQYEGVAVVTIDRPEVRNAISPATMDALEEALDAAADANVMVIRGSGDRAFVSGGDLKELAKIRTHDEAVAMAVRMRRLCDRIATFPAPVIAALNGHALGGGAEVAVAADIRVAADDIRIGFNQASLAIMPGLGRGRTAGRPGRPGPGPAPHHHRRAGWTPPKRHRIGLIDRVYPRAEFEASWRALAGRMAASPARPDQVGHRPGRPPPPPRARAPGR